MLAAAVAAQERQTLQETVPAALVEAALSAFATLARPLAQSLGQLTPHLKQAATRFTLSLNREHW
jgi:hypothetical protein